MLDAIKVIAPAETYAQKKKYFTDTGQCEEFIRAEKTVHNSFMRSYLKMIQYVRCPLCGEPFRYDEDGIIHHNDYNKVCNFNGAEIKEHVMRKNNIGLCSVPDCKNCYFTKPALFKSCVFNNQGEQRLVMLHSECHNQIHRHVSVKFFKIVKQHLTYPAVYSVADNKHYISIKQFNINVKSKTFEDAKEIAAVILCQKIKDSIHKNNYVPTSSILMIPEKDSTQEREYITIDADIEYPIFTTQTEEGGNSNEKN